ncbi:uncharacterized protein TNCV_4832111 [Trichonephila clavipes]|nr:uncharacterized protein TNCV_4832111 [Trichonephila clavipes]
MGQFLHHFLATRTLRALADDEKAEFPDAADVICNDSYMDDILSGESTLEDAPVKTLGMLWDPKVDCLTYKVKISEKKSTSQKRRAFQKLQGSMTLWA